MKKHLLLGFTPFFYKELQEWKYQKQAAIALLILLPLLLSVASVVILRLISWQTGRALPPLDSTIAGSTFANVLWVMPITLLLSIGIIPKEVEQGTLAWNLTKPLSRTAFLLGKWAAYTLLTWLIGVVLINLIALTVTAIGLGWVMPDFRMIVLSHLAALLTIAFWVLVCIFLGLILKDQAAVMAGAVTLGLIGFLLPNLPTILSFLYQFDQPFPETWRLLAQLYPSNTPNWFIQSSTLLKPLAYCLYVGGMAIATQFIFDRKEYS
jgi:ABC-type transport system involved in multi-copper enzyme maturation permease subunit